MMKAVRKSNIRVLWIAIVACVVFMSVGGAWAKSDPKITICHKGQTITIAQSAWKAHQMHGDKLGKCPISCEAACTREYKPVTCENGNTYNNTCLAGCAGQTECTPCNEACSKIYEPVICDGNLYGNACLAMCAGQTKTECEPKYEACPKIFDPVICGDKIYGNRCLAWADGKRECTSPECASSCSKIYDPVKCADGNTYGNECIAECAGATGCEQGDCPKNYDPVGCADGNVYNNRCLALRAGQTECGVDFLCPCDSVYNPVICGDKVYDNLCLAECAGAADCDAATCEPTPK
jgi:hypothetical protein